MLLLDFFPNEKIFCYGLGISIFKMKKDISSVKYLVDVPSERLV
ncbi:MAG: hypothetical protein ACTSRH_17945 [Promethearchaeota archaeon]